MPQVKKKEVYLNNLETQAAFLYKEQKYPEALDIYLSLYQKSPKTEKYSIFCGNCFDAMGDESQAVRFYKKAARINPVSLEALTALANLYYHGGDYNSSEKFSLKILKKNPDNVSALLNLGNIAYCRGDYQNALDYYEKVYLNNKSSYIAVINMANTCYDLERYVKALEYAQKALEVYPSSVDAYIILGNSYFELGRNEKAESCLLRALEYRQDNSWIYASLSRLYQKSENWEQALQMGWLAVVYAGNAQEEQHINFGYLLYECADEKGREMALYYAQKWLSRFPDDKMVAYMAQAIISDKPIDKADIDYIRTIFDQFSTDFDSTLAGLEYQVPEYIALEIEKFYKKQLTKQCRWLDVGCGTGLCGVAAKPFVGWCRLDGLDISQKMLNQAKLKGIYDHLFCEEIVKFLTAGLYKYNLITAGDVLTYFGDLREVFEQIAANLCDEGLFICTISENTKNKEKFVLTPSGRFVHSQDYVSGLLKKCGYNVLSMDRKPLRNEGDRVVYGWVVTARKAMIITK